MNIVNDEFKQIIDEYQTSKKDLKDYLFQLRKEIIIILNSSGSNHLSDFNSKLEKLLQSTEKFYEQPYLSYYKDNYDQFIKSYEDLLRSTDGAEGDKNKIKYWEDYVKSSIEGYCEIIDKLISYLVKSGYNEDEIYIGSIGFDSGLKNDDGLSKESGGSKKDRCDMRIFFKDKDPFYNHEKKCSYKVVIGDVHLISLKNVPSFKSLEIISDSLECYNSEFENNELGSLRVIGENFMAIDSNVSRFKYLQYVGEWFELNAPTIELSNDLYVGDIVNWEGIWVKSPSKYGALSYTKYNDVKVLTGNGKIRAENGIMFDSFAFPNQIIDDGFFCSVGFYDGRIPVASCDEAEEVLKGATNEIEGVKEQKNYD